MVVLSGVEIITRQLVRNLRHIKSQRQPCGIDLTLRQISKWTSAATIDFDNSARQGAKTSILPFDKVFQTITLPPGAYLVEFNESVKIPLNCVATVHPRSTLWRNGLSLSTGIVDAGYEGPMGSLLHVMNLNGVVLYDNAKLGQIVFQEMRESVGAYRGVYQRSLGITGLDGPAKGKESRGKEFEEDEGEAEEREKEDEVVGEDASLYEEIQKLLKRGYVPWTGGLRQERKENRESKKKPSRVPDDVYEKRWDEIEARHAARAGIDDGSEKENSAAEMQHVKEEKLVKKKKQKGKGKDDSEQWGEPTV